MYILPDNFVSQVMEISKTRNFELFCFLGIETDNDERFCVGDFFGANLETVRRLQAIYFDKMLKMQKDLYEEQFWGIPTYPQYYRQINELLTEYSIFRKDSQSFGKFSNLVNINRSGRKYIILKFEQNTSFC